MLPENILYNDERVNPSKRHNEEHIRTSQLNPPKYSKQKLTELWGQIHNSRKITGHVNICFIITDRITRQKINRDTDKLNAIKHLDLTETSR